MVWLEGTLKVISLQPPAVGRDTFHQTWLVFSSGSNEDGTQFQWDTDLRDMLNSTLSPPDTTTMLTQCDCPGSKLVFWGMLRPSCIPMPAFGAGGGTTLVLLETLPPPKSACKTSQVLNTLCQLLPHLCSPQRS